MRFLIFRWVKVKNLASRILSLNLKRLSRDYEMIYGHPVYLAETFVDLSVYRGSCYRAANWIYLGQTKGFSKNVCSLLGLALCARLCGARSFIGIGEWVKGLSKNTLRRFGIRGGNPLDESTIRRAIQRIDVYEFDKLISDWLMSKGIDIRDKGIGMDAKTLRGSSDGARRPLHLLSAVIHKEGRVIGSQA